MVEAMALEKYNFVMCNFAPPDMVGHTGFYDAAVKAVEATGNIHHLIGAVARLTWFEGRGP